MAAGSTMPTKIPEASQAAERFGGRAYRKASVGRSARQDTNFGELLSEAGALSKAAQHNTPALEAAGGMFPVSQPQLVSSTDVSPLSSFGVAKASPLQTALARREQQQPGTTVRGAAGLSLQEARQQEVQGVRQQRANHLKTTKNVANTVSIPGSGRPIGMVDTRKSRLAEQAGYARVQGTRNPEPLSSGGLDWITGSQSQGGAIRPVSFALDGPAQFNSTRRLTMFDKVMEHSSRPLATLRSAPEGYVIGDVPMREAYRLDKDEAGRMAVLTRSHRRNELFSSLRRKHSHEQRIQSGGGAGALGILAAKYESGEEGIAAIGYDRVGGTSYGKYQISSRAGTMNSFLRFLRDKAPDLAKQLVAAGPANTGSKRGGMPTVWKKIAAEEPDRFERLQSEFIRETHYEPAVENLVLQSGIPVDHISPALQEVVFSTAVQHGAAGAARIIGRAVDKLDVAAMQNPLLSTADVAYHAGKKLIQEIYAIRSGQFSSSTKQVQAAAKNRLRREMQDALAMHKT